MFKCPRMAHVIYCFRNLENKFNFRINSIYFRQSRQDILAIFLFYSVRLIGPFLYSPTGVAMDTPNERLVTPVATPFRFLVYLYEFRL